MDSIVALLFVVTLLAGNAFFVSAEFALVSARRSEIEPKALAGSRRAKITLKAMENVSLMMAGAQLGITACSLGLGALGEPAIAQLLESPLHAIGVSDIFLHPISFAIALLIMTFLHVVLGEMVPKNITLAKPDRAALLFGPSLARVVILLKPFVSFLNSIANICLKLIGINPLNEVVSTFTRDEVAGLVEESRREGLLSEEKEQLVAGTLDFDKQLISSVLIPLEKLATIERNTSAEKIESLVVQTGFSRLPVVSKKGLITGYVHIKDVLAVSDKNRSVQIPVKSIRSLASVKEYDTLRAALTKMQRVNSHLALVLNRKGETIGVAAFEDVLEELVGEIRDENQSPTSRHAVVK